MSYPLELYPTIVSGKIWGPIIRYESLDGSCLEEPIPGGVMEFDNFGPFERGGKIWGVTHLQKYCTKGWLKVAPDCFHSFFFWKLQAKDENGQWIPGSEQGFYVRKSRVLFRLKCWRWDVAGTVLEGELRHWINSGGYGGMHWD